MSVKSGLAHYQLERLSRVDYAFDYYLPEIDFDEDSFVSLAQKDTQHRKNNQVQTFDIGSDLVKLRVYNKVDEIIEKSKKIWFFKLWVRIKMSGVLSGKSEKTNYAN